MRIPLVPYFAWGNRGAGEMRVWLQDGGRRENDATRGPDRSLTSS